MSLHALRRQVARARRELAEEVRRAGVLAGEVVRRYHVRTMRDAGLLSPAAAAEFARHAYEAKTPWGTTVFLQDEVMPRLGYDWDGLRREWVPGARLQTLDVEMAAGRAAMLRHRLQVAGDVVREDDVPDAEMREVSLRSQLGALRDLAEALREAA